MQIGWRAQRYGPEVTSRPVRARVHPDREAVPEVRARPQREQEHPARHQRDARAPRATTRAGPPTTGPVSAAMHQRPDLDHHLQADPALAPRAHRPQPRLEAPRPPARHPPMRTAMAHLPAPPAPAEHGPPAAARDRAERSSRPLPGVGSVPMPEPLTRRRGPPVRPPARDTSGEHLTDGRRLLERLRPHRPRRRHRRVRRGLPRSPARAAVALVDEDKIGGTCLHRGCIPTKAMLESAGARRADPPRRRTSASGCPAAAEVDFAQIAKRRDQIVNRMWKGVGSLVKKNDVTWIQGRGRLEGATKVRVSLAGEDGTPGAGGERLLNGTDVVLATGSRVKSLPGHRPGRHADRDLGRRPARRPRCPAASSSSAPARSAWSSRRMYHDLGAQVTLLEYLPAIVPLEDHEVSKELERTLHPPRDQGHDQRAVRRRERHRRRRRRPHHRRARGRRGRGDLRRDAARRGRPRHQRGGRGPRDDGGRGGPRHRQGRRPHAHEGAAPVRDRRHRGRAAARAHGRPRGDHRRRTRSSATRTSTPWTT